MAGFPVSRRGEEQTSPPAAAAVPDWPPRRSFFERHPWLLDGAIATVYAISLALDRIYGILQDDGFSTVWHVIVAFLTGGALLFRRYRPLEVLIAVTVLTTMFTWSLDGSNDILAIPLALYAVAAFRSPRLAWIAGAGAMVVAAIGLTVWLSATPPSPRVAYDFWNLLLILAIASVLGVLFGSLTFGRRQRLRTLEERAEQLARERDNQATIATLAERSRIAREMHDIVAHSLSVMVALADGAAAAVDRNPAMTKQALGELSETGRSALDDMRKVLSVLREESSSESSTLPAPTARDVGELVERFRTAGLPIRFTVAGEPAGLPAQELAMYRILQESLTNVLRYADGVTTVDVALVHGRDACTVTVLDDGHRKGGDADAATTSVGSGRGIIGMTERASMLGGRVEAGPAPSGGWRVKAVLPARAAGEGSGT
ncbi:sensor histidine kinase [Lysobacter korlensis]|uniref:histidine kinase n=1 Tax=Lysobacter korlensis TaxID=553636 RepID=A0ABV6RST2_9GAMM